MTKAIARIGRDAPYATQIDFGTNQLVADEPAERGGGDTGPAPYELLLASLGSCTAITLRMYAERKQWAVETIEVALFLHGQGETLNIERILTISGTDAEQNARLAEIAEKTPVTLTLKRGVPIETRLG
ncbi:OsmC family protein [Sphingomonas kyeonggiensis]|uniref:Putative redox protein n=1 Tax=Sphingomonas kyeonggiensis TaxID=1268553 RepID=A0A7W6JN80_9SPHN|nr:OsmC family protein [Sphingomonas kyeonggiensis]MBB4096490.1 putative redox protein [Sphingomonas kyeonggiensis]